MTKVYTTAVTRRTPLLALSFVVLLAAGCVTGPRLVTPEPPPIPEAGAAVPEKNEIVLSENTQLVANTAFGDIKIEAGPGLRRVFNWNDVRRGAIMEPRTSRFAGSLGIKYDGTPPVWAPAQGVTELKYEEGQRRFENADDALIWMQIRRLNYTYNNSGIVVGWQQTGSELHVELWQFYIDGQQPQSMPNADDAAITISPLQVTPQKMAPQLVFADGRTLPYTEENADQYKSGGASKGASCNWFEQLLKQCSKTATEDDSAASSTPATTTPAAATPGSAAPQSSDTASSTAAEPTPPAPTESAVPATIDGSSVNIRSSSSTKSDVLFQAKKGDKVEILKEESDWRYVKFADGRKGWVADFLLKH